MILIRDPEGDAQVFAEDSDGRVRPIDAGRPPSYGTADGWGSRPLERPRYVLEERTTSAFAEVHWTLSIRDTKRPRISAIVACAEGSDVDADAARRLYTAIRAGFAVRVSQLNQEASQASEERER